MPVLDGSTRIHHGHARQARLDALRTWFDAIIALDQWQRVLDLRIYLHGRTLSDSYPVPETELRHVYLRWLRTGCVDAETDSESED